MKDINVAVAVQLLGGLLSIHCVVASGKLSPTGALGRIGRKHTCAEIRCLMTLGHVHLLLR